MYQTIERAFPAEVIAYIVVFLTPFVQEDAAVLAAATASVTRTANSFWLFIAIVVGLSASDLWKYWLGRAAHIHPRAARMAQKPLVQKAQDGVVRRLGLTLLIARFVPGTRIPLYLASGYFKAPFGRFAFFVVSSGILYVGLAFLLMHSLGSIVGEKAHHWLPLIAIGILIVVLTILWLWRRLGASSRA